MHRRRLLAAVTAVLSPVVVAGCSDGPAEELVDPPARVAESELVREHAGTPDETVAAEGTVERTQDVEITYLEVRVEFYDGDGDVADSTVEQVDGIDAGDRWPFRVVFPHVGERAAAVVDHDAVVVRNP
ncbi:MAG: FxLYD domain-containing protein [Halorubrum sp.]